MRKHHLALPFILGDVLGAGIYALVGEVAGEVGGAVWVAFTVGLVLALCTAFAYAELVTKYPHAGGAALYINRAFKRPFLTFIVAFALVSPPRRHCHVPSPATTYTSSSACPRRLLRSSSSGSSRWSTSAASPSR